MPVRGNCGGKDGGRDFCFIRKEHSLVNQTKDSVDKLDDKMIQKMNAFEEKMHNHLAEMERRWTDKVCSQGSGSSDEGISTADYRIHVLCKVHHLCEKRTDQEDKIAINKYENSNTSVQQLNLDLTSLKEKGGRGAVRPVRRRLLLAGEFASKLITVPIGAERMEEREEGGEGPSGGGYGSMRAYFTPTRLEMKGMGGVEGGKGERRGWR